MALRQLVTFFGLAYLVSFATWFPLYSHIFGINNLQTIPYQHALGALGPLVASFLTTWIYEKREGVRKLIRSCFQSRPVIYLIIAFLGPFLLVFIASLIIFFTGNTPVNLGGLFTVKEFPEFNFFTFFIYNLIFFGFGEETGWRGFALPRLQSKMNALSASTVLTFFWALWHLPLFFYRPGYTGMDVWGIAGWIFSLFTGSILLTWLYNSGRGSILICAIFHSTIDIVFMADLANKNVTNYLGFLITVWGLVTIVIFKPGSLSFTKRQNANRLSGYSKNV